MINNYAIDFPTRLQQRIDDGRVFDTQLDITTTTLEIEPEVNTDAILQGLARGFMFASEVQVSD